jgi:DNA-binding winged helix-turn-helix (wHTH) protein
MVRDWMVAPERGLISRTGQEQRVEPKAMELLVYLAAHQGEVVTREELEKNVWRGALVGYGAVTNSVIKLRKALGDQAREPGIIATIPKRGSRLVAPVRYLDVEEEQLLAGYDNAGRDSAPAGKEAIRLGQVSADRKYPGGVGGARRRSVLDLVPCDLGISPTIECSVESHAIHRGAAFRRLE